MKQSIQPLPGWMFCIII